MAQHFRPELLAEAFLVHDAGAEVLVAIALEVLDAEAVLSFFQNQGAVLPEGAVLAVVVHHEFPAGGLS